MSIKAHNCLFKSVTFGSYIACARSKFLIGHNILTAPDIITAVTNSKSTTCEMGCICIQNRTTDCHKTKGY